jgi:hypothetical protein
MNLILTDEELTQAVMDWFTKNHPEDAGKLIHAYFETVNGNPRVLLTDEWLPDGPFRATKFPSWAR